MYDNLEAFFIFLNSCERLAGVVGTVHGRRLYVVVVGRGVFLHSLFLLYGCHRWFPSLPACFGVAFAAVALRAMCCRFSVRR
jgi:hypothetical protein